MIATVAPTTADSGILSTTSIALAATSAKESPPLKRTHAITDLHQLDDFSPVTFDMPASLKSEEGAVVAASVHPLSIVPQHVAYSGVLDPATISTVSTSGSIAGSVVSSSTTIETSMNNSSGTIAMVKADSIEETKVVIVGINVRAAKLPKLVETLVMSFGTFFFPSFCSNQTNLQWCQFLFFSREFVQFHNILYEITK
jgi:hypothetical protein